MEESLGFVLLQIWPSLHVLSVSAETLKHLDRAFIRKFKLMVCLTILSVAMQGALLMIDKERLSKLDDSITFIQSVDFKVNQILRVREIRSLGDQFNKLS